MLFKFAFVGLCECGSMVGLVHEPNGLGTVIVSDRPTIMDGVVYDWRWSMYGESVLSASRNGVFTHQSWTAITTEAQADELRDAIYDAWQVYAELRRGQEPRQFLSKAQSGGLI